MVPDSGCTWPCNVTHMAVVFGHLPALLSKSRHPVVGQLCYHCDIESWRPLRPPQLMQHQAAEQTFWDRSMEREARPAPICVAAFRSVHMTQIMKWQGVQRTWVGGHEALIHSMW